MLKPRIFKTKSSPPVISAESFYTAVPVSKRFEYLNIELPETASLDRRYDWKNGDIPAQHKPVQWLLLLEYISFVESGNFDFQRCWLEAPTGIKRTLFLYMLKRLYPDICWTGLLSTDDPDMCLPVRQQLIRLGGLIFRKADVPFVMDSDVPWPGNNASGGVELDISRAIGRSAYLQSDALARYSLRAAVSGDSGPSLIMVPKTSATIAPVQPSPPNTEDTPDRPMGPDGTYIESHTMLKEMGYNPQTNAPPQDKDFASQSGPNPLEHSFSAPKLKVPGMTENPANLFSRDVPTAQLPSDNDRVFLVSGVTQGIIGQGGMGRVYKILLKHLEVVRALKILQPAGIGNDPVQWQRFCTRFLREIKLLSNLHHTHIAQIHDFGEWERYPYIEMEYVPGSNLKDLIGTSGRMPLAVTSAVAIQVARALTHAHNKSYMLGGQQRRGLIHRDMKPQNVIVSQDGESKLLDFGVALPMGMITQTMQSNFVGTLQYAAPEQIEGVDYDQRIDIYSFGQVMYEMICGRPPFNAPNIQKMLQVKMANEYTDINAAGPKVPKSLKTIIRTCMQMNPGKRFRTSDDLLASLEEAHREVTREIPDAVVRDYVRGKDYTHSVNRDQILPPRSVFSSFWPFRH